MDEVWAPVVVAIASLLAIVVSSAKAKRSYVWHQLQMQLRWIGNSGLSWWEKIIQYAIVYYAIKKSPLGKIDLACVALVAVVGYWDVIMLFVEKISK